VTAAGTALNPEQARRYQQIAWDVARSYRWAGLRP
jgi:hypothetical protein